MTSGSNLWGTTLSDKTGYRDLRNWSGSDGRTEVYAGAIRTKWNPYTTEFATRTRLQRDYSYKRKPAYGGNTVTGIAVIGDPSFPPVPWTANDELKLQDKLLGRVKSHDFNLAVNVGQHKQIVGMLSGNLRKLGRAAIAVRRGDLATAARQLGARPKTSRLRASDVSGRWLELQYGWRPLIQDSFEAAKAFHAISQGPRSATVRAGRRLSGQRTITYDVLSYDVDDTYHKTIQYRMYEEMSVGRQLGLVDPASVAWELCPWSFVVDWFIPIGTYLENLNQIPKLRGQFLTTVYRKSEHYLNMRAASPLPSYVEKVLYLPTLDRGRRISVQRDVSSSLSPPLPRFHASRHTVARENGRLWNAIALAHQAFAGTLRRW